MASSDTAGQLLTAAVSPASVPAPDSPPKTLPFFYFPKAPMLGPPNSILPAPPSEALVSETLDKLKLAIPEIDRLSVRNALRNDFSQNDPARAALLLGQYRDAVAGMVVSISEVPKRPLLQGAVNTNGVSCYIDSLIFAMFVRMENFEPLLYQNFDDPRRSALSTWLRLFVNLSRSGELVTKDIVHGLMATCVNAGWGADRAISINGQQDAAEFFGFLTDALKMPQLSLRVEIAHAGRENAEDDHKVVTEQLLYLPVPGTKDDMPLLLEECLEMYFANSINVNRRLARGDSTDATYSPSRQRSYSIVSTHTVTTLNATNTGGVASPRRTGGFAEAFAQDGESLPQTPPTESSLLYQHALHSPSVDSPLPSYSQLFGDLPHKEDVKVKLWTSSNEITFPAWMFLQLLPFYADVGTGPSNMANLEAQQVANHFSKTRPVLGLCLKRYYWGPHGEPMRNDRRIIVPETIFLPSFVADDSDRDQAFGNFKLELESAIFHRGNSIHSGHYLGLVCDIYDGKPASDDLKRSFSWRSRSKTRRHHREGDKHSAEHKRWLFLDDMAPVGEKVQEVDFNKIMTEMCPYMLFYRMVALDNDTPPPEAAVEKELPALPSRGPRLRQEFREKDYSADTSPHSLDPLEEEPAVDRKARLSRRESLPNISELNISDSSPELLPAHPATSPDMLHPAADLDYADRDMRRRRHRFLRRSQKDYAASYREEKCMLM